MQNIKCEKVIFPHPTIPTKRDMDNLKWLLGKVWMKKAVTYTLIKHFQADIPSKVLQWIFKRYKIRYMYIKKKANINLQFEPVTFQAEYKRKSLHTIIKILGFNLLFSNQHQAYTLSMFDTYISIINYVFCKYMEKDFAHKLPEQIVNINNVQILNLFFMQILNEESSPVNNCALHQKNKIIKK